MLNTLEMIESIKKKMDFVADMHGWARCVAIHEVVAQLEALSEGWKKEQAAHRAEIALLQGQLKAREANQDEEVVGGGTVTFDLREANEHA